MKKMQQKLQKVLLVTNLLFISGMIFSQEQSCDDCQVLECILQEHFIENKKVQVAKRNQNTFVVQNLNYFEKVEQSLPIIISIDGEEKVKYRYFQDLKHLRKQQGEQAPFFNQERIKHFTEQQTTDNSFWSLKNCKIRKRIKLIKRKKKKSNNIIFISKPIYTKDKKYSLVYYRHRNILCFYILHKKNTLSKWEKIDLFLMLQ